MAITFVLIANIYYLPRKRSFAKICAIYATVYVTMIKPRIISRDEVIAFVVISNL